MKPPQIGPKTGPRKGASENNAIGIPSLSIGQISVKTPPLLVNGEAAAVPLMSLHKSKPVMVGDKAQPILKTVYKNKVIIKIVFLP